ncbi:MAG: FISUMP domain-containing protein [Gemmatimonadaceae bacterium]
MNNALRKMTPIHIRVVVIALGIAFSSFGTSCLSHRSANDQEGTDTIYSATRMPDRKHWMAKNLNVATAGSYCYEDSELNCSRYGRLYTWESAQRGCQSLGGGWRLPTNDEWRQMAKHYGGVRDDSDDGGKSAYKALFIGGSSGFNVVLGGGRDSEGQYARLEAHGFYWTASESGPASAWLYNFGRALILNRHSDGEKQRAFSVRCVRE